MKKVFIIIEAIVIVALIAVILTILYYNKGEEKFTVTFDSNGGSKVNSIAVKCGDELSLPKNPSRKGYSFLSWVDKNGTPIYDKALLSCEDITLKANWKKNSSSNNNSNKNSNNNKNTQTSEKTYKCPEGYTLTSDNKCLTTVAATNSCATNYSYSTKQKLCYSNETASFTKKCKKETINGKSVDGELVQSRGTSVYCGYDEFKAYYNNERSCKHINYKYSSDNNKCYYLYKLNNYDHVCPSGYTKYSAGTLDDSQKTDVCVKTASPRRPCPDGYSLDGNVCKKYVDATYE